MEILGTLGTVIGSALSIGSGGLLGILGAGVSTYFKNKAEIDKQKADREWELKKWEREDKLFALQMSAKQQDAENEVMLAGQEGSWDSLATSIEADTEMSKNASQWAINTKTIYRPVLTTLLWIQATWVFYLIAKTSHFSEFLGTEQVAALVEYMVYTIFFTAATASSWWFAERAIVPTRWKQK